jgi:hypothetical protein
VNRAEPGEALRREALRLHERYHRELIERFSVCPWAKAARVEGRTRTHVVTEASCSAAALAPLVGAWATDETVDVAFVILPRFTGGRDAFAAWVSSLAEQTNDVFLSAPFYPGTLDETGAIQFLRQTPDPTAQLVRRSRLEEIRAQDPPHYKDIFELDLQSLEAAKPASTVAASVHAYNQRTLEREGRAGLKAILEDIRDDRNRTYALLDEKRFD